MEKCQESGARQPHLLARVQAGRVQAASLHGQATPGAAHGPQQRPPCVPVLSDGGVQPCWCLFA